MGLFMTLSPDASSKTSSKSKTSLVIGIIFVVLAIPAFFAVIFLQNFHNMSPHEQSFYKAIGADLRRGDWRLTTAKATAQRNLKETRAKKSESAKREDEADRKYQQILKQSWKEHDAALAAKRKVKKVSAPEEPVAETAAKP